MQITHQIWVSIGLIIYYAILQIYNDFKTYTTKTNTKSVAIEALRTKYRVTIRTFHAKQPYGFASFKSIWINEVLLKTEKPLLYTFHHEYYHLKHNHKFWLLFMRFIVSLTPLVKYFVNWWIVVAIILAAAFATEKIRERFEVKANNHAKENIS